VHGPRQRRGSGGSVRRSRNPGRGKSLALTSSGGPSVRA
jgi:hypothetical protein